MRFSTALVAGASLAYSSAFLITPEIAQAAGHAKESFKNLVIGTSHDINVKCHECPFILGEAAGVTLIDDDKTVENSIHLEFSTSGPELQVNNVTIFSTREAKNLIPKVRVHQTREQAGQDGADVTVGFALSVRKPLAKAAHRLGKMLKMEGQQALELITVDFTVMTLDQIQVQSQTARVDLIHHDDVVNIARVQAIKFHPGTPGQNDLEVCRGSRNISFCRVKLLVAQKMREMLMAARARAQATKEWMRTHGPGNKPRPCTGMPPTRLGYPATKFGHNGAGHHFDHQQHRGGHYHHHQGAFRVLHYVMKFVHIIVIPALLGAVMGFTIGAIGMVVGTGISMLWARFRGRRQNAILVDQEVVIEAGENEKEGLLVIQSEEPPAYEYRD